MHMLAITGVIVTKIDHPWHNDTELLNCARGILLHDKVECESHDEDKIKIDTLMEGEGKQKTLERYLPGT